MSPLGRVRAAVVAVALAGLLALSFDARAAGGHSRVVISTSKGASTLVHDASLRLAGELRGAGFIVDLVEVDPALTPPAPTVTPAIDPPFATIALAEGADGTAADVRVVDRVSDKTLSRRVAGNGDSEALAIRASELLRASLLELAFDKRDDVPEDVQRFIGPSLGDVPPPPAAPVDPPAVQAPKPLPARPREAKPHPDRAEISEPRSTKPDTKVRDRIARVSLDFAVLASFGGFTPAIGPALDVRCRLVHGLDLLARIAVPFASADLRDDSASSTGFATLRHGYTGVSLGYRFGGPTSPLRPSIGSGLGVYILDVNGTGASGYQGRQKDIAAFTPSLDADLEIRFHDRIRGELGVSALFPVPSPVVYFVDQIGGKSGEPMFLSTVGLAVAL